jgi:hypothetical protein
MRKPVPTFGDALYLQKVIQVPMSLAHAALTGALSARAIVGA